MRWYGVRLWVPIAVVLLAASPTAIADADRVERARATVLDDSYQKELPINADTYRSADSDTAMNGSNGADDGSNRAPPRPHDDIDIVRDPGPTGGILSFLM